MANGNYIAQGIGAFLLGALGGAAQAKRQRASQQQDFASKILMEMVKSGGLTADTPGAKDMAKAAGMDLGPLVALSQQFNTMSPVLEAMLQTPGTRREVINIPGLGGEQIQSTPTPTPTPVPPVSPMASADIGRGRGLRRDSFAPPMTATPAPTPTPEMPGGIPINVPQRTYRRDVTSEGRPTIKAVEPTAAQFDEALLSFSYDLTNTFVEKLRHYPSSEEIDAALQEVGRIQGIEIDFDTASKIKGNVATSYLTQMGPDITPETAQSVLSYFGAVPSAVPTLLAHPGLQRVGEEALAREEAGLTAREKALPLLRQEERIRSRQRLVERGEAIQRGLPEGESYAETVGGERGKQETGAGLPQAIVEEGARMGIPREEIFRYARNLPHEPMTPEKLAGIAQTREIEENARKRASTPVPAEVFSKLGLDDLIPLDMTWSQLRELQTGPEALAMPGTLVGKKLADIQQVKAVAVPILELAKKVNVYSPWDPRRKATQIFSWMGTNTSGAALNSRRGELSVIMRSKYAEKGNLSEGDVTRAVELFPFAGESAALTELKSNLFEASLDLLEKTSSGLMKKDEFNTAIANYEAQIKAMIDSEEAQAARVPMVPRAGTPPAAFGSLVNEGLGK